MLAREEKLVKYLDIPIQHACGEILKRMNRRGDSQSLLALVNKIRATVPDVTLRTTLITGFPGETEQQYEELHNFVREAKFDRLGCFTYSAEEGTIAAEMPDQVDQQVKQDRAEHIMETQRDIASAKNEAKIGTVQRVLIEGWDDYIKCYYGRSAADAPEIDGKVFFMAKEQLLIGEFADVQINDILEYDLLGEMCDESSKLTYRA